MPPFRISAGGKKKHGKTGLSRFLQPLTDSPSIGGVAIDSLAFLRAGEAIRGSVWTRIECKAELLIQRRVERIRSLPMLILALEKHSVHLG